MIYYVYMYILNTAISNLIIIVEAEAILASQESMNYFNVFMWLFSLVCAFFINILDYWLLFCVFPLISELIVYNLLWSVNGK